jgi:subtilase family serine protease
LIALQSLIDQDLPPPIVNISYGECEAELGQAGNASYNEAYEQAAAEGASVFVSSGDEAQPAAMRVEALRIPG